MKTIVLAVAAAGLAATTAFAAVPPRDALVGSEIRRNVEFGGIQRYEVLRLAPDGSFTGVYETTRPVTRGSAERHAGGVRGRWSLKGDALCFEGKGLEYAGVNCYRLSKGGYSKRQWSGVNERTGDVWQFFIYPRGS
ncbi:MAG: hypothetical protein OEQ29_14015 [Alphaproteobacteria bacterium]|nr:hypothetical protein [Alphaproteobacteria bacterium]